MDVMKFKGHPLTDDVMKSVKGGYEYIVLGDVSTKCPVCENPIETDEKTHDVYNNKGELIGHAYRCNECGCMVEANGKA